jgi:RHS repeat-associated protein
VGIGWSLSVPHIVRRTDQGFPLHGQGSLDRFVFGGQRELVPIAASRDGSLPEGEQWPAFVVSGRHQWTYFRSRVETSGNFSRFFQRDDDEQWVVQDSDGVLHVFGAVDDDEGTQHSVVAFEEGGTRYVFRWNLTSQVDTSGNRVEYRYFYLHGQSYLADVYWNNPPGSGAEAPLDDYQHHVELVYGSRDDTYFSYASGFRQETTKRLERVTVESVPFGMPPGSAREIVRSYLLGYDPYSYLSLLTAVQVVGAGCTNPAAPGCSVDENGSLPALTMEYTGLKRGYPTVGHGALNWRVEEVLNGPASSVQRADTDLFDANSDGIPDVLNSRQAYFGGGHQIHLGSVTSNGVVWYSPADIVNCRLHVDDPLGAPCDNLPSALTLSNPDIRPLDIDGDGRVELLRAPFLNEYKYYRLMDDDGDWQSGAYWEEHGPFGPLDEDIDFSREPGEIRLADVNNDRLIDVIRTSGTRIETFVNLGRCPGGDGLFGQPQYDRWGTCIGFSTEPLTSCLLVENQPLSFSDSRIRLADMNGDGLQDIVSVRPFSVDYWPGRGPGVWGAGPRSCEEGTLDAGRELEMDNSPWFDEAVRWVHLDDINGDGTADLVQVGLTSAPIWLNENGQRWTDRIAIRDCPLQPYADSHEMRLVDVNGSGTKDILWGIPNDYRFLDVMGGQPPRLLRAVHNSLGGTTELTYRSTTSYMAEDRERGQPWVSTIPRALTVVASSTVDDGWGQASTTEYGYRDPVYDRVEGKFRGFSQAWARAVGDDSTPSAVTVTRFYTGEAPESVCADDMGDHECRLVDNPHEALEGHAYLVETRTDPSSDEPRAADRQNAANPWNHGSATYLETAHTSYTLDLLYNGLDGHGVWFAWPSQTDTFRYGTDALQSGGTGFGGLPGIVQRTALPGSEVAVVDSQTDSVVLRAGTDQLVRLRTRANLDRFGRIQWTAKDGIVGRAGDEATQHQRWGVNPAAWIHRPCMAWIDGDDSHVSSRLNYTHTFYEGEESTLCSIGARGLPTYTRVRRTSRNADGSTTESRWLPQQVTQYNNEGLVVGTWGGVSPSGIDRALRHARRAYDLDYGAHVVEETVQVNRADQPESYVTTRATWNTGWGTLASLTDANGQTSYLSYDGLGRQTALYRPLCQEPSKVYEYSFAHDRDSVSGPYVRTLTNQVCDRPGHPTVPELGNDPAADLDASSGVSKAYAVVDGLGRVRATMLEGDSADGFSWILADVKEFDARGNVSRAYQPLPFIWAFHDNPLISWNIFRPVAPFEETGYDAFGRPLWSSYADGTPASSISYGADRIHRFDANDLDASSAHHGTPTTLIKDGLDRTVVAIERLSDGSDAAVKAVKTSYDRLGNVVSIASGAATFDGEGNLSFVNGQVTTRYLLYDSLGQRTHNLDPDAGTYLYFYNQLGDVVRTIDARGVENRYLYDLGGRLIAEDLSSDGASWATTDSNGQNTDDLANLTRLAQLTTDLFNYQPDADNDFLPEQGADVLYGFDSSYDGDSALCRARPDMVQAHLVGRPAWVRNQSGCSWTSYDERGRSIWAARQVDPGEQLFVTLTSYASESGPDDQDRVRSETYPDGTSVHYTYSNRGLLESVTGDGPEASSLFAGRTFVSDLRHDEFAQRSSWVLGDPSGNQATTSYQYDERRRLERMSSHLNGVLGDSRTLVSNRYVHDQMSNIVRLEDERTLAETAGWATEPVTYEYEYDALYRLTKATPTYVSGTRPLSGVASGGERIGVQEWTHDGLGSMQTWTAIEEVAGEHFFNWSLGNIVNGQELIATGASTGVSSRCGAVPEAVVRVSGPAPHALYFAYQAREAAGDFAGLEACYDAAGNLVALYRLELSDCGAEPLAKATADWTCGDQQVVSELRLTWEAAGRLARVEQLGDEGIADIRHVYDATGTRVIRLDHESTEGSEQATLYVSRGFEVRDASLDLDGSYFGGEETKHVFAGDERIARVVERVADGVEEWPNAPGRAYVFQTLTNHLGSASVTFNAGTDPDESAVVIAQTQLPYGVEDARVRAGDYGGWQPDYEFTGKELDPDVGLMYFGARFYVPGMGRWSSVDPAAYHDLDEAAGLNYFCYVHGNPLILVDPSGKWPEMPGITRLVEKAQARDSSLDSIPAAEVHRATEEMIARNQELWATFQTIAEIEAQVVIELTTAGVPADEAVRLSVGIARGIAPRQTQRATSWLARNSDRAGRAVGRWWNKLLGRGDDAVRRGRRARSQSTSLANDFGCFVAGTPIWTEAGAQPIDDIAVGELVWSRSEKTGELVLRPVVATYHRADVRLGQIVVQFADGVEETLTVTAEHPFWVEQRGWVRAIDLAPGDPLFSPQGQWLRVSSATWFTGRGDVYNFHVDTDRSYFVGQHRVWVHNNSKATGGGQQTTNLVARFDSRREGHVFREAPGHVNPASANWRARYIREFEQVASNPANMRADAVQRGIITQQAADAGVQAFTQTTSRGRQVWVTVRNGIIQNAGVNRGAAIR